MGIFNMNLELISAIIGVSIGIGAITIAIGYAYAQFKSGGDKYKDNLIDTLKESVAVLEAKNKQQAEERTQLLTSHQVQLTDLNKELGILQGRFDEQTRQLEAYKTLLQGRDPEQIKIMTEIREALVNLNNRNYSLNITDTSKEVAKNVK